MKRAFLTVLLLLPAGLVFSQSGSADTVLLPVSRIFYSIPLELRELPLWVPAFDAPPYQDDWNQEQREKHARMLTQAEEANTYLREILDKYYQGPYRLITLDKVKKQREAGARFFLDVVIMPRQMEAPDPRAMVAAFRNHSSTNFLYSHHNIQFHYYFYIRDLQTDEAFLSSRFRGNEEVYRGMVEFLKRVRKELSP